MSKTPSPSGKSRPPTFSHKRTEMTGHLDIYATVEYVHRRNSSKISFEETKSVIATADKQIKWAINENMYLFPCPYCGSQMVLVTNTAHYNSSNVIPGYRWICSNNPECDANIGCHGDTCVPLGIPAGRDLRQLRKKCHGSFDILWKTAGFKRAQAYNWLARRMGLQVWQCHVAVFNEEMCHRAIGILNNYFKKLNHIGDDVNHDS